MHAAVAMPWIAALAISSLSGRTRDCVLTVRSIVCLRSDLNMDMSRQLWLSRISSDLA